MAGIPSKDFKQGELFHSQADLETYFNLHFTLPQTQSWIECRVTKKLASRMISCLRGKPLLMASLNKLPKLGKIIGKMDTVFHTVPRFALPQRYISLPT